MKYQLPFILLIVLSVGCEKEEPFGDVPFPPPIWELEATLFDPGDGSGVFESVESERRIGFISGKVATNGSFCDLTGIVGPETEARFDEVLDKIVVENCDASGEDMLLGLEVSEDQEILTISLPCEAPCLLRYRIF